MLSFTEAVHDGWGQSFRIDRLLHYEKTALQELVIFDNACFGRVLALDGLVQLTERDHHVYHEMIAHVPVVAHGAVREVLVIGGGDGGVLREVLRHEGRAGHARRDRRAGDRDGARASALSVCGDAFDDPRAEIVIGDGLAYVRDTDRRFDVIVVDSTDPIGPSAALFGEKFYRDCRRCLNPGGRGRHPGPACPSSRARRSPPRTPCARACSRMRPPTSPRCPPIPAARSRSASPPTPTWRRGDLAVLRERWAATGLATRYYAPDVHVGAFALPPDVRRLIA